MRPRRKRPGDCDFRENGECWNCGCCDDPRCCDQSERCIPRCGTVIGFQLGEPVFCGAAEAIHGDALGMVSGHDFDADGHG